MRILLIAPMLPEADGRGAIPVLLHSELVGLSRRHEVTLVAGVGDEPGEAAAAASLLRSGIDLHIGDRRRPRSPLGRWKRRLQLAATWLRGRHPWRTVWFATPAVQATLDELARARAFDVVAVEDNAMAMLRLPPAAVTVLTEYEVRSPRAADWRIGPPRGWARWAFREADWTRWSRFQTVAWRRFDRVLVFTQRDARAIAEIAPDVSSRVRVSPFGLVAEQEAGFGREESGLVLFVGNFTHYPNRDAADWLARIIMPLVQLTCPSARVRIVGSSPPPEILELADPGVEILADAVDIRAHLESACVVVAPVRVGGGMRMKVLQALSAGKAVVTTPRGAEGYLRNGVRPPFAIADDAAAFAAAIAELLADVGRRRELGSYARGYAREHHSVESWVARLEAIYDEAGHG